MQRLRRATLPAGDVLIEARGISVRRGGQEILEHVDLALHRRHITTLVGSNGSGKTSLVQALVGLTPVCRGQLARQQGLRAGYVPQHFQVDPNLPMDVQRFLRTAGRRGRAVWQSVIEDCGISPILHRPMQGLSGGEMRRVLMARALLRRPHLLVLDEPAAGLDSRSQGELYGLIRALRDRQGCAVLVVSHDLNLVMAASDQVLCLDQGRILCRGEPETVMRHPEYQALFGSHLGPETAVFAHRHGPEAHDHG